MHFLVRYTFMIDEETRNGYSDSEVDIFFVAAVARFVASFFARLPRRACSQ